MARPSAKNLSALPEPDRLKALCQSLALLDLILQPDFDARYFSFDPAWGRREELASMRDGEGGEYYVWFSKAGAVIRGFALHAPAARTPAEARNIFRGLPRALDAARKEPAFDESTFAIWREKKARAWSARPEPREDGSKELLWMLDDDPRTFVRFAAEYHGTKLALADVREIYAHRVDAALVARINPRAKPGPILASARRTGFTVGSAKGVRPPPAPPPPGSGRAATAKLLADMGPDLLTRKLRVFTLIDAIVAPKKRLFSLHLRGRTIHATLTWGGAALHVWLAGKNGLLYGWPPGALPQEDAPFTMPPARAAIWRKTGASPERATLLAWWGTHDDWTIDRSDARMLPLLAFLQNSYRAWAAKHYGRALAGEAVAVLWPGKGVVTREIVRALSPKADWNAVAREAKGLEWKVGR